MSRTKINNIIPLKQLELGYDLTIDNAIKCLGASQSIATDYPDKALSLAQLGQEELGKSLTLLAAAALPKDEEVWSWFWDGWRNHKLKAHRAYLYEIINPLRIEVLKPDGTIYAGEPLCYPIHKEKESGLYVDFDLKKNVFIDPSKEIDVFTAMCRISTLLYLCSTADAIRHTISLDNQDFRMEEMGRLALTICTENVYQQDWPSIKVAIRNISRQHQKLVDDLDTALLAVSDMFDKKGKNAHGDDSKANDLST